MLLSIKQVTVCVCERYGGWKGVERRELLGGGTT